MIRPDPFRLAQFACAAGCALFLGGCATDMQDTRRTFSTVVIDAGHGGHDPGAVSRRRTLEKEVALDVALRLEQKLKAAGFHTVMTRSDDRFIPLAKRVKIANAQRNAIFVSIHFNYARSSRVSGMETFYYHPYGREIAARIQTEMLRVGGRNRGVKHANFHVLRNARYPAVLVECGFLTNLREERLARTAAHREQLADRIARALIEQRYGGGRRFERSITLLVQAGEAAAEDEG